MDVNPADASETPLRRVLGALHARHSSNHAGEVASYIPELADANPDLFGIAIAMVDGTVHEVGDTRHSFTIQSISKPLTYGIALEAFGPEAVGERIGLEPTGDPFNSIDLGASFGQAPNAMVNSGAIVAADLVRVAHGAQAGTHLVEVFGRYAGRELFVDTTVAASERRTGHRNRAIAHLLRASAAISDDPEASLDLYFDQCSVAVDCRDLALVAATLANGGRNPLTGALVAERTTVRQVLTVMATCGMYDGAGTWLVSVGLPAKSGVSGGIIAVLPGQFGIAVYSPPLDERGNSVRGTHVCTDLAQELGVSLVPTGRHERPRRIDLDIRGDVFEAVLRDDIEFTDAEALTRRLMTLGGLATDAAPRVVIIDVAECDTVHDAFPALIGVAAESLSRRGTRIVISGAQLHLGFAERLAAGGGATVRLAASLDEARAWSTCQTDRDVR